MDVVECGLIWFDLAEYFLRNGILLDLADGELKYPVGPFGERLIEWWFLMGVQQAKMISRESMGCRLLSRVQNPCWLIILWKDLLSNISETILDGRINYKQI